MLLGVLPFREVGGTRASSRWPVVPFDFFAGAVGGAEIPQGLVPGRDGAPLACESMWAGLAQARPATGP